MLPWQKTMGSWQKKLHVSKKRLIKLWLKLGRNANAMGVKQSMMIKWSYSPLNVSIKGKIDFENFTVFVIKYWCFWFFYSSYETIASSAKAILDNDFGMLTPPLSPIDAWTYFFFISNSTSENRKIRIIYNNKFKTCRRLKLCGSAIK